MRQTFTTEMEGKLRDYEYRLARLAEHPKPDGDTAREARERHYHFLRTCQDELRDQLRQLKAAPDDAWEQFKLAMERVYDDAVRYMDEVGEKIDGPEDAGVY